MGPRLRDSCLLTPLAAGREFTQPRAHLLVGPCSLVLYKISILGYLMVIGGFNGTDGIAMDDVELVSLDPTLRPLPECLIELSPLPVPVDGHAGALDYSG